MLPEVRSYLDKVRLHLFLDPKTEKRVIGELYAYFEDKIAELQENGLYEKEATREAIRAFGRARVVARLMYEAYSKGSWAEVFLTALPHLTMAMLFFLHIWFHPVLAPVVFTSMVAVTLLGWWHGKPNWLYSWIGYALLPLLIGGYASFPVLEKEVTALFRGQGQMPGILILLPIFALFVFSLWIIIRTTARVVKRDWILATLMLVPLPILGSWLFYVQRAGGLFQENLAAFSQWDISMALVLSVLALAAATFVRLRQRVLKVMALVTLGMIAVTMTGHVFWGDLGFLGFVSASAVSFLFLLSPALLEARIGHGEARDEAWWAGSWLERPSTAK
jgi:hypothetical protein